MKKQTMKKVLAFALAAVMVLGVLTACGKTPGTGDSQDPVVIDFWHHYSAQSPENETLMNVLIPKFEEENPGYKINAVSHEWAELHDKIIVSAGSESGDSLPDVARLDIAWVPEFQKMDILVPLDKDMSDFSEVSGNLLDSAMSTGFVKGNYYAMALNTNTKILFYNEQALADAGIAVPTTMDELYAAAAKLSGTNANGQQVWGLNEPALSGWNVLPYIWSNGGAITNDDYTKATGYLNSEATVATIQKFADMYKDGQFTGFNSVDIPMTDGFGTGRYMMLLEGPWKTAEMDGAYPDFKYGTSDMPAGAAGSHSVLGGEDIAMFKGADSEGAWLFMKFMTSEFAQEEMAKCGQIPVNKTALESATVKEAPFAPFLSAITTAVARPPVASWSEIDNLLSVAVTDIIVNGADAQATMDALAAQVDTLLAE